MINVAVLVNSMANIRPKSVIILIGAVRPGPKYGHARKKTAGYHLFRNVLPECNPILGSQLTAAATQLFSRDVRKRPAYVLCFSTRMIALRQELVPRCGSRSARCHCAAADPDLPPTRKITRSANGMVRPCSCPPASEAGKGRRKRGARHVSEIQHHYRRDWHRYRQELVPRRRSR